MSKSYTPGLKILRNTKIVKERKLPLKGTVNASMGDDVKSTEIVASTSLPGNIHMLNIANQLNIDPGAIKDFVKVSIDQKIDKGEVLAENNGFFGFFKSQVLSPLKGYVSVRRLRIGFSASPCVYPTIFGSKKIDFQIIEFLNSLISLKNGGSYVA